MKPGDLIYWKYNGCIGMVLSIDHDGEVLASFWHLISKSQIWEYKFFADSDVFKLEDFQGIEK